MGKDDDDNDEVEEGRIALHQSTTNTPYRVVPQIRQMRLQFYSPLIDKALVILTDVRAIPFVVRVEKEKERENLIVSVTPSSPYNTHTYGSFASTTLSSPSNTYDNGSIASLTISPCSRYRRHNHNPNRSNVIFTIKTTNNNYF